MEQDETFEQWWEQVKRLAEEQGCEHLLGDPESHRQTGYDTGATPEQEIEETIYAAAISG